VYKAEVDQLLKEAGGAGRSGNGGTASVSGGPSRCSSSVEVMKVGEGEKDEFELTGDEATARWHQVRGLFNIEFVVLAAVLLASWLLWHRTLAQLGWMSLGVSALGLAASIWKHDLLAFSYNKAPVPPDQK
jgi:hypothetical protein